MERTIGTDDGATLWTDSSGSGPGLVLCHGGPGMFDDLEPVAAMVDDLVTVHRWDQRGAGRSSRSGPFTVARFVRDLERLREAFGLDRWIVAGHSWGANLALHYALARPERARALLYLNGTGLAWGRWKGEYHAARLARLTPAEQERFLELKRAARTPGEEREYLILNDLPNYGDRARARSLAEQGVERTLRYPLNYEANGSLNREVEGLEEDELVARCARLTMPALVVRGEGDPRPAAAVDSLVRALPSCTLRVLPGVGHEPWRENPAAMRQVVREFTSSVPRL